MMMMMMMMLLAKRRLCSMAPSPLLPRFFSSASATPNPDPKTPTFVLADYLVSSFGFSPDKAARVSKRLAHFKSPEKPDSVFRFLKDHGFSQSDVKKLVTLKPDILRSSSEKTLDPNLRSIRDMGLSASAVNQIILSGPQVLHKQATVPRIRFWMDFFDGDEAALVRAFKQNLGLVDHDTGRLVSPKISLLRSQGFSTQEIQMIVCKVPRFITRNISGMEDLLKRTQELGFQPGSGLFLRGLKAMVYNTRDVLQKKMNLFMSFGWSEEDFFSAVRNAPLVISHNEENLRTKMEFLLGEARCAPSYINSYPTLLTFSLEKRLRPRNDILHLLKERGLSVKGHSFVTTIKLTNNQFMERYIIPYKEEITGLHETYLVACV